MFFDAVQNYKHILTIVFASKMKIWYNILIKNVQHVFSVTITKEFVSSKGLFIIIA